jgi:hypothetical protein
VLKLGELVAYLKTDDKEFDKGLKESHSKFGEWGTKLGALALSVGAAAGIAVAGYTPTAAPAGSPTPATPAPDYWSPTEPR